MSTLYLTRYGFQALGIAALIEEKPDLIIVIPAYKEPALIDTLKSVASASKDHNVVVIPVINFQEESDIAIKNQSQVAYEEVTKWAVRNSRSTVQVVPVIKEFSGKKSGVGYARKTGMDEAVRIYEQFDSDGIIVNLDADCIVSKNYIYEIVKHFSDHPKTPAAAIFYEHLLENPELDLAIINYELHLRYFISMQRFCALPYAYQTVGSCMAVRSKAYQKQGGMNKRKAGEDFYFMQKMMQLGNFTEINNATVYPSSRTSDRVPFGTGRAMLEWHEGLAKRGKSYHPESFIIIKIFLEMLPELFFTRLDELKGRIPLLMWQFLESQNFHKAIYEMRKQSKDFGGFQKQFYRWFDGFRLMKFVHFSRDHFYPDQPIRYCVDWMFREILKKSMPDTLEAALIEIRREDRKGLYNTGFHSY
ncbi:MAG: glycosyltransferase [Cyclobacteriaceae bacterium]